LFKGIHLGPGGRKKVSSPLVLGKEAKMERIPMDFTEMFCDVDDFCQKFEPVWRQKQIAQDRRRHRRQRKQRLSLSERMTIIIAFHASHFRDFKHFYLMLRLRHRADFPGLVSYTRFVQLMPSLVIPLSAYLQTCYGKDTGIAFIDSTALAVCGNKRIRRNRVFHGLAKLGKTTMGWFFGFKLHLVINECGELLAVTLTPGNVDDRKPVPSLARRLAGKLFGDKGYISAGLFHSLWERGVQLITSLRRNMKNSLMPLMDKILLRKRSLIETVNDQLKNIAQVEHTRHRSVLNFAVNLLAGLISYARQPKKPALRLHERDRQAINTHALPFVA
jgi:transposase